MTPHPYDFYIFASYGITALFVISAALYSLRQDKIITAKIIAANITSDITSGKNQQD